MAGQVGRWSSPFAPYQMTNVFVGHGKSNFCGPLVPHGNLSKIAFKYVEGGRVLKYAEWRGRAVLRKEFRVS